MNNKYRCPGETPSTNIKFVDEIIRDVKKESYAAGFDDGYFCGCEESKPEMLILVVGMIAIAITFLAMAVW